MFLTHEAYRERVRRFYSRNFWEPRARDLGFKITPATNLVFQSQHVITHIEISSMDSNLPVASVILRGIDNMKGLLMAKPCKPPRPSHSRHVRPK